MAHRFTLAVLMASVLLASGTALAFDDAKYPDLKGRWRAVGNDNHFPGNPPYTPEYQKIHEAAKAELATGSQAPNPPAYCLPPGMPRQMNGQGGVQFVVTPEMTHILIDHIQDNRRIYTDGRGWPEELTPTFAGTSIGKWVEADGSGKYGALLIETRGFKGPRGFGADTPMHADNETVIKERLWIDKQDADLLHDEFTIADHSLAKDWVVTKTYKREATPVQKIWWREAVCVENNPHLKIAGEDYMLSGDGKLMPTHPGQQPPDLRYFKPATK